MNPQNPPMVNDHDYRDVRKINGSPLTASLADEAAEREVALLVEPLWDITLRSFGMLAEIDWYALRAGHPVGLAELKNRSHSTADYPTVILNFRKWDALFLTSTRLGWPAIFIARLTDAVLWIDVQDVDPRRIRMGGQARETKSVTDREPVIHIPLKQMKPITVRPDGEIGGHLPGTRTLPVVLPRGSRPNGGR